MSEGYIFWAVIFVLLVIFLSDDIRAFVIYLKELVK